MENLAVDAACMPDVFYTSTEIFYHIEYSLFVQAKPPSRGTTGLSSQDLTGTIN